MPLRKVIRDGQITIPKEFREFLDIKEGDVLEVEMENNVVVLKPKSVMDKGKERFFKTVEKIWEINKNVNPKEVERVVDEAVRVVRGD